MRWGTSSRARFVSRPLDPARDKAECPNRALWSFLVLHLLLMARGKQRQTTMV